MNDKLGVTRQRMSTKNSVPDRREEHVPRPWGSRSMVDGSDRKKPEWLPEGRGAVGEEDRGRGLTMDGLGF